jgi:hypothetical protein
MKKGLFFTISTLICALGVGCASQDLSLSADPVCLPNISVDQAMESVEAVLTKMQFELEKNDPEARYMRTRPLSGAQFFEFWKRDNASAFSSTQANLYSIRRIVEVEFIPENTTSCIQCRVQVLRLSIPEQPLEGTTRMGGIYTESSFRSQTLEVDSHRATEMEWLDAGPDHALERKILKLIQQDIQKGKDR